MKFFKQFSVYTITTFLNRGVAFLLFPLFTNVLSKEEYGILGLVTTLTAFVYPFINVGIQGAIDVEYFRLKDEERASYISSALRIPVFAALIIGLIFLVFSGFISEQLNIPRIWVMLIPLIAFLDIMPRITQIILRIREKVFTYSAFSLSATLINIIASVVLVALVLWGYKGRLIAIMATTLIFSIVGVWLLRKEKLITLKFNKAYAKQAFWFGFPLITHMLANIIINQSDKVFISKMLGNDELGVYTAGYQIGSIVAMISGAFMTAFSPFQFRTLNNITEKGKIKIVQLSYILMIGLTALTLFIGLLAPTIFKFLAGKDFYAGHEYVFWVALGYLFSAGYYLFSNYIYHVKKTKIFIYLSILTAGTNMVLNYFFIQQFGAIGAAYATALSFLLVFLLVAIIANRLYPMPWFSRKITKFKNDV